MLFLATSTVFIKAWSNSDYIRLASGYITDFSAIYNTTVSILDVVYLNKQEWDILTQIMYQN